MIENHISPKSYPVEKLTDIETVLNLLRLIDNSNGIKMHHIINEIVGNTLKDITNPYARKLLIDKMTGYKKQIQ